MMLRCGNSIRLTAEETYDLELWMGKKARAIRNIDDLNRLIDENLERFPPDDVWARLVRSHLERLRVE